MKILIQKRFVIIFENGVVAITHWKIHNHIKKDRYKPTIYINEKSSLSEDKNGMYTLCLQIGSSLETQVRLV